MSGKYLLDTSVIIALFADDAAVKDNLEKADEVFIPCIAIGELYYGARKSARIRENVARIDEFAADNVVLECNSGTARRYGEIKNTLREKGRPIPENDIWIAAMAWQHDLMVATRDTHFNEITNLKVAIW
ncbi:type II toxin-antitoxin system VapC family toxin [Candidatus Parcubacteria bacterium]|nr:MAG: type II toxin-antitoxin system VapC family toxin [Candidatus Parcubacteria bacterium]